MTITEILEYLSKNVTSNGIIFKCINREYQDLIYYNESLYYFDSLNNEMLKELTSRDILIILEIGFKFQVI